MMDEVNGEKLCNTDVRDPLVAAQIERVRKLELTNPYTNNRGDVWYIQMLQGYKHLFNYLRNAFEGSESTVLDVGAGTTRAVKEIEGSSWGKGLRFEATVLDMDQVIEGNLPEDRIHVTPVEELSGIADKSMAAILSVFSVGYSDVPDLAVESIDRVLMPGGVFKGNFHLPLWVGHKHELGYKTEELFENKFIDLGFDVAKIENEMLNIVVLIAVKQGGTKMVSAKELINLDQADCDEHVLEALSEHKRLNHIAYASAKLNLPSFD